MRSKQRGGAAQPAAAASSSASEPAVGDIVWLSLSCGDTARERAEREYEIMNIVGGGRRRTAHLHVRPPTAPASPRSQRLTTPARRSQPKLPTRNEEEWLDDNAYEIPYADLLDDEDEDDEDDDDDDEDGRKGEEDEEDGEEEEEAAKEKEASSKRKKPTKPAGKTKASSADGGARDVWLVLEPLDADNKIKQKDIFSTSRGAPLPCHRRRAHPAAARVQQRHSERASAAAARQRARVACSLCLVARQSPCARSSSTRRPRTRARA